MSIMSNADPFATQKVIELVTREREMALSAREWKHRLAGYGYSIRETPVGQVVEKLPNRIEICVLPGPAAA